MAVALLRWPFVFGDNCCSISIDFWTLRKLCFLPASPVGEGLSFEHWGSRAYSLGSEIGALSQVIFQIRPPCAGMLNSVAR